MDAVRFGVAPREKPVTCLGNAPCHSLGNTACPDCGMLLIERRGLAPIRNRLRHGRCRVREWHTRCLGARAD